MSKTFTLIELIIDIAIIVMLATILFPIFGYTRERDFTNSPAPTIYSGRFANPGATLDNRDMIVVVPTNRIKDASKIY